VADAGEGVAAAHAGGEVLDERDRGSRYEGGHDALGVVAERGDVTHSEPLVTLLLARLLGGPCGQLRLAGGLGHQARGRPGQLIVPGEAPQPAQRRERRGRRPGGGLALGQREGPVEQLAGRGDARLGRLRVTRGGLGDPGAPRRGDDHGARVEAGPVDVVGRCEAARCRDHAP